MKSRAILPALVLALIALPMASGPASAQTGHGGASGNFIVEGLTLSGTQFGTPSGQPTTVPTDPLSIPVTAGDHFTYSTITCATSFPPWNTFGLQFDPDYPGLKDPAPIRYELRGAVTQASHGGSTGRVAGTITGFLCEHGMRTDQIVTSFEGTFQPTSATSVPLAGGGPVPTTGGLAFQGMFRVIGGTGRFQDLEGHGSIIGQFTCFASTLTRNHAHSCTQLGAFSEVPFQQRGPFGDPTTP